MQVTSSMEPTSSAAPKPTEPARLNKRIASQTDMDECSSLSVSIRYGIVGDNANYLGTGHESGEKIP